MEAAASGRGGLNSMQVSSLGASGLLDTSSAMSLHRQVASDATEKETAKADFSSLKRELELHLGLIKSALLSTDAEQVMSSVRALDEAFRTRVGGAALGGVLPSDAAGGSRAYEILRRSLDDSQRRCAMLNEDMMQVAETNDELMGTMNAVKSANRRLVEQIQKQTVEIDDLTQARVMDEERIENLRQRHENERELWNQDAARQIEGVERTAEEAYEKMRSRMTAKLHEIRNALVEQRTRVTGYVEMCKLLRGEMKSKLLEQWVGEQMRRVQREVKARIESLLKNVMDETVALEDRVHQLGVKLEAERDTRAQEERNWTQRLLALEGDHREMERSKASETEQLTAQLEAVQRTCDMEADMQQTERREMHARLKTLRMELATLETKLSTTRMTKVCQETQRAKREAERNSIEEGIVQLRGQVAESDGALDRAVSSNEDLRREMELQRSAAQAQNDEEMQATTDGYVKKLSQLKQSHEDDTGYLEMQVRVLADQITARAAEVQSFAARVNASTVIRSVLQRDAALWKAQEELAEKHGSDTQREYEACQEEWEKQRSELREGLETAEATSKEVNGELDRVKETSGAFARDHRAKAANQTAYAAELDSKVREAEAICGDTKLQLQARLQEFNLQKQETAAIEAKETEEFQDLNGQLELISKEEGALKQELENALLQERRNAQAMMEQFARMREDHQASLSQAQGEPQAKLAMMEKELGDFTERARRETKEAGLKVVTQDREIQNVEAELARAKEQLDETERALTEETNSIKGARASHLEAKGKLEQENRSLVEALQSTKARNLATQAQLEERIRMGDAEVARLHQGLQETRAEVSKKLKGVEEEEEKFRVDYETELRSRELFYKKEATRETQKLDTIIRENERLRTFVGEHRHSADAIDNVGAAMQAHLSRMEQQTMDMRNDLGRLDNFGSRGA